MEPIPPEPMELKQQLREILRKSWMTAKYVVRGSMWSGTLWSDLGLRTRLQPLGMTWKQFEELQSDYSHMAFNWLEGKTPWERYYLMLLDKAKEQKRRARGAR